MTEILLILLDFIFFKKNDYLYESEVLRLN